MNKQKRAVLYKKCKRCVNITDTINNILITIMMGLGIGGIGLQSTIIVAAIIVGMASGALVCGF